MTVIQLHEYGRAAGICPVCHLEVGNLARHEPSCRAKHENFYNLSDADWMMIERAAAHTVQVPDGAVTDLDMARVFLHLERGRSIVQGGGPYRWRAEDGSPLSRLRVGRTVDEMLRLGLVRAVSVPTGAQIASVVVVPSPVHLRSRTDRLRPSCKAEALRFRLVDHPALADCPDCLA